MILTISRFTVAAETPEEIERAISIGLRWYDNAPGFLSRESFTDPAEPGVFYFATRWADEASLRSSYSYVSQGQAIPEGFEPDIQSDEILVLNRAGESTRSPSADKAVENALPLLARFLQGSRTTHYIAASLEGTIQSFNEAAAVHLKIPASQLAGLKIWSYLTADDATRLWKRVQSGNDQPNDERDEKFLINFVDAEHFPYTLECRLELWPDHFCLIGELPQKDENVLREHLLQLTNQLALLTRENAQKSKALEKSRADLEKALNELNDSYWHMRKISEYLPICMQCHLVRTADAQWENVADYLNRHSLFLTHSLCPACYAAMEEDVKRLHKEQS